MYKLKNAKKLSVTDGRTDGRTDGPTDTVTYRVACTRLKMEKEEETNRRKNIKQRKEEEEKQRRKKEESTKGEDPRSRQRIRKKRRKRKESHYINFASSRQILFNFYLSVRPWAPWKSLPAWTLMLGVPWKVLLSMGEKAAALSLLSSGPHSTNTVSSPAAVVVAELVVSVVDEEEEGEEEGEELVSMLPHEISKLLIS